MQIGPKLFKLVPWQPHGVLAIEVDQSGKPEALAATWYGEEPAVREWVAKQSGTILGDRKLAPPVAKLNIQHDYITLTVTWGKEVRANLTMSRYGMKVSGKGLSRSEMEGLLAPFDRIRKMKKFDTNLEMMRRLETLARNSVRPSDLIAKIAEEAK